MKIPTTWGKTGYLKALRCSGPSQWTGATIPSEVEGMDQKHVAPGSSGWTVSPQPKNPSTPGQEDSGEIESPKVLLIIKNIICQTLE